MILMIDNKGVSKGFILFIKKRMLTYCLSHLELSKLDKFDEYFKSEGFVNTYKVSNLSSRNIIYLGISHLSHRRYETETQLSIDDSLYYPGTNIKISSLCKLINFGNMDIDGYPIFSNTFQHFRDNIDKYIDKHIMNLR